MTNATFIPKRMDLYIFANFGKLNEIPKSGGQTSARRVMDGMKKIGYDVHPIVKHRSELKGKIAHQFEILFFAFIDLLKICSTLIFKSRKNAAFMMLTYAGSLVPFEWIITKTVRVLGYKSIYYLKGGKLIDTFSTGSERHKRLFKATMDDQALALFEGTVSMDIVKGISDTTLVYFPNYISDGLVDEKPIERSADNINVLYFGRIAPEKHIDVCIDAFEILCEKYKSMHLTIIGGYTRAVEYGKRIEKKISDSAYSNRIEWIGNSPFELIQEKMKTHRFFIFPTHEKAEGHSNSLTEAMSQGLIPVASNWHFNKAIVGDDLLIVEGYDPHDYAKRIDEIISDGNMDYLSDKIRKRVEDNYLESVVLSRIGQELQKVFI